MFFIVTPFCCQKNYFENMFEIPILYYVQKKKLRFWKLEDKNFLRPVLRIWHLYSIPLIQALDLKSLRFQVSSQSQQVMSMSFSLFSFIFHVIFHDNLFKTTSHIHFNIPQSLGPHDPSLEDDDVCYLRPPVSGSAVGQVVGTWARTRREL